jgi:hypothetical protein
MATRIPVAWVVLVVIVGIFAFFGYYIAKAASSPPIVTDPYSAKMRETMLANLPLPSRPYVQPTMDMDITRHEYPQDLQAVMTAPPPQVQMYAAEETAAPAMTTRQRPPVARPMPTPVGMTEEDMRLPEPLQRSPPATHYDPPEATDPLNRTAFMDAEFGSNLRHPEQMIEHRGKPGVGKIVASGLGSERSSPGPHNAVGYSPEMTQNGGDFMQGVGAFDDAEMNSAYSMI